MVGLAEISHHGNELRVRILEDKRNKRDFQLKAAMCWGSHINWQLLHDYLVFDRDQVIKWGFFDNLWRTGAP